MLHVIALALALSTPHKLPAVTVTAKVQCDGPRLHIRDPFTKRHLYYCTK